MFDMTINKKYRFKENKELVGKERFQSYLLTLFPVAPRAIANEVIFFFFCKSQCFL